MDSVYVKIYDNKVIPGLGRGPIINPTKISKELYRTLYMLNYTMEVIDINKYKKEEAIKSQIKVEIPPEVIEVSETPIILNEEKIGEPINDSMEETEEIAIYDTEEKNYDDLSDKELRKLLKDNDVKFSNAMSREKLEELAIKNNL